MPSTNHEIARLFTQMADVMEVLGVDRYRVLAYQKAARSLEECPTDVSSMKPDDVACLANIGKTMHARITEFLTAGQIADHQKLMAQVPPGVVELMGVPALGPKTLATLWKEGGVTSREELLAKIEDGSLEHLPRIGKKKLEQIAKNLAFLGQSSERRRIGEVRPIAEWFVDQLRAMPNVERAEYAGSLRRGKETIADVDLVAAAEEEHAPAIAKAFAALQPVESVIGTGDTKTSVRTYQGLQVDLRILPPSRFGAALHYFTGSKEHNIAMRQRAIERGLKLSEWGVFKNGDDEEPIAAANEEDVFRALGLAYIPPELREDHGELELAEKGALPKLLEEVDIRSELHAHTVASDGVWTIEEFARWAIARGFHTIAITDHSKGQVQANGLTNARLVKHIEEVRKVAKKLAKEITILAGSECDILADGSLDYPDELLAELDVVVASPHAALTQEDDKATNRLLRAIENPYVTIMGHPTGRLVARRAGINPDMAQVVKAAAQRGVALEINANYHRLDLRDAHARLALDAGCKLSINTDAHAAEDTRHLVYGVLTARRAGARAEDVVNTFTREGLREWLASTRA